MGKADDLRALAHRVAAAGGKRISVTPDSARAVAGALEAYADYLSIPRADFPTFTVDVWDPEGRLVETMAWTANSAVGRAAFDAAVEVRGRYEVTLRNGIRVVAIHRPSKPDTSEQEKGPAIDSRAPKSHRKA